MQLNWLSKIRYITILSICILFMFSCTVSKNFKHYVYLADSVKASHLTVQPYQMPKLRVGDRLQITVTALNPIAAQAFNQGGGQVSASAGSSGSGGGAGSAGGSGSGGSGATTGYLINSSGNIQFPQIGNVKVEGLTTDSLEKVIEVKLLEFLKEPVVTVNQINFNINLIGEIYKPGVVNVPDGKLSILEAIARSGDLTLYGKRENVLVIREKNGKREFGRIDLTSNNIFNSPYYYLEQGDVVYVDVNENKLLGADMLQTRRLTMVTIILGAITTLFVIKNYLKL